MTHNDFDHLAQLLPEKRSPCAVGSNILHSVFIQPGFVVAISILQFFFFFSTSPPVHSYTTATLQGYNTIVAKSIQKHLFQQAIPDGVFLENLKAIVICKYLWTWGIYFSSVLKCVIKYNKRIYIC